MNLSMLDNKEISLYHDQNSFDSFLCAGITLAIFNIDGNTTDKRDRLNTPTR